MIRDLVRERPEAGARADVCVVGAGAAGIVLTMELLRLGKSVVLLEGGGAEIEEASQEPYRSELTGLAHQGIHAGRVRAQGGTTLKWGGQILELDAWDFERREWVAGSGWPFGKSELTRFYERALELEGLGGVMRNDEDVWRTMGQTTPPFGELEAYFTRWCPEPNFARVHGETLRGHPGLTVWLHANAVELVMEEGRATGVRARTLGGEEAVFAAEEFCFCMGTIESARFFLQPRAGGLPWNESGLLGRHFQDHIDVNAAAILPRGLRRFHDVFDSVFAGGLKYHPKLRLREEAQRRLETLNVAATMFFESDADEAAAEIKATVKHLLRGRFGEVKGSEAAKLVTNLPLLARQTWRYAVQHRAYHPADAKISLRVHCEQEPGGASSITLAEERDSLGMLRTRLDWRISELEVRTVREYVQAARGALAGLAEVTPAAGLMEGSADFVAGCDDTNHHMGGMRMAAAASAGWWIRTCGCMGRRTCLCAAGRCFRRRGFRIRRIRCWRWRAGWRSGWLNNPQGCVG